MTAFAKMSLLIVVGAVLNAIAITAPWPVWVRIALAVPAVAAIYVAGILAVEVKIAVGDVLNIVCPMPHDLPAAREQVVVDKIGPAIWRGSRKVIHTHTLDGEGTVLLYDAETFVELVGYRWALRDNSLGARIESVAVPGPVS